MRKYLTLFTLFASLFSVSDVNAFWSKEPKRVSVFFVNCTGQDVRVFNPEAPYKYSLTDQPAHDKQSPLADFVIPGQTVLYLHPYLSIYHNHWHHDGLMKVSFSGGVEGTLDFSQDGWTDKIASSSPDIAASPTQQASELSQDPTPELHIFLGCEGKILAPETHIASEVK